MRLPKIILIIISLFAVLQGSAFARFGSGPTFSSSASGGGNGGLNISPIYADALTVGQINTLTKSLVTYNGNQYAAMWDRVAKNLVLCKRVSDAPTWTCVNYNGSPKAATFTGAGLNDLTAGGTNTNTGTTLTYDVEIDSTGATDTFKWRVNGGSYTTGVSCAITATTLSNGLSVVFGAITGHTLGNSWTFVVNPRVVINGDLHQSIDMQFDSTGILHLNLGSYVTESGLKYRRTLSAESIDGLTSQQTIDSTYDAQASYVTFIKDATGQLFAFYRSNGASGDADEFLWKYTTGSATWARAAGTRSSGVIGSFIDGNTAVRSAYMGSPVVTSDNFIHFIWSWQVSSLTYGIQRQSNISYVKYDATNGIFYKSDDSVQTIPITLSNDDAVWDSPNTLSQGVESLAYARAMDIDPNGNPNVIINRTAGDTHSITFTGSGTNDLLIDYVYPVVQYDSQPKYEIEITSTSSPNQFKYRVNGGAYTTLNNCTAEFVTLTGGLRVAFSSVTGHTNGDKWTIYPPNAYAQLFRYYYDGASWQSQQLTNDLENMRTSNTNNIPWGDGIAKRSSIFYNGSKAYIIYGSMNPVSGIRVLETSDWESFKSYLLAPGGVNDLTHAGIGTIDVNAWDASKKIYMMYQVNPSGVTSNYYSFTKSPVNVLYWNPASGASFQPMTLKYLNQLGDFWIGSVYGAIRLAGLVNIPDAHFFWAQESDKLNDIITNKAVSGDTIYLASGTYTIVDPIAITKSIALVGQGRGKTTISSSSAIANLIKVTSSNASLRNLSVSSTAAGTSRGINVDGTTGTTISGVVIDNVDVTMSGTGTQIGIEFQDAGGLVKDTACSATSSNGAAVCFYNLGASTQEAATTINILNPNYTVSNNTGTGAGIKVQSNSAASAMTNNIYGGYSTCAGGGGTRQGIEVTGGANAIANVYNNLTLNGTTYDAASSSASSVLNIYDANLVNNLTQATGTLAWFGTRSLNNIAANGTITSAATGSLGWSIVDQTDNQACTTGCTSACVFGIENATGAAITGIVDCAATTSDLCACAGAS